MTTTAPAPARAEQRATVRRLIDQGLGNRAIARHPGMPSRDTVRRWRTEWEAEQPPVPPQAPPAPDNRATPSPDAPPPVPPAPDTRATTDVGARQDAPPVAPDPDPDLLTVPATGLLREHLAVLAQAGIGGEEAIALCVGFVATAIRDAWDHDVCAHGVLPAMRIGSYNPLTTPTAQQAAAHPNGVPS